jgi:5-oxoprolinase (ATP-hydrolysing) subunit B
MIRGLLPCGTSAVLIETDSLEEVLALYESLSGDRPHGVVDLVPAARTLLVRFDSRQTVVSDLERDVRTRLVANRGSEATREIVIPVRYDGVDLDEVARLTGLTSEKVSQTHASGHYRAAFSGFAPGFAYLSGLDPALHVPRRATPRTKVPSRAVAIAGEFTAIYPRESPGGWQVIGHTTATVWDITQQPPALLSPGTRVRFQAVA